MSDMSEPLSDAPEEIIFAFEHAWKSGTVTSLADFIPDDSADDTDLLTELACIDLQYRLQNAQDTRVEFYTKRFPQLADDELLLLELIRTECAFRSDANRLDIAEYSQRFPRLVPQIEMMLQLDFSRSGSHITEPDAATRCVACDAQLSAGVASCAECGQPVTIDRYVLLERIGEGAFGFVYRAQDPKLHREVAVKTPRAGQLLMPEETERFLRESRSAAQLDHPGIVRVFDAGRHLNIPYIVSEFVDGQTLADRLQSRPPDFREAAAAVLKVAEAVAHAHANEIVHRDLKPSNIMTSVAADGALLVRVMDFGLARNSDADVTVTVHGQAIGTPAYMSPEQARGEIAAVGPVSDVYSIGVILFQLLCGELPFRGSAQMLMQQVIHEDPPSPSRFNNRIPRDLETVCLKAIHREPGLRYQSAAELADDLRRWLQGEPVQARRVGVVGRTARWCRRRPAVATLLTGLLVSLVTGISGIAWQWQRAETARRASEADLADALESVERVLGHLGSDTLADIPQAKQLRADVLNDALEFFERFRKRNPDDPRIAMQVARSHVQVARIRGALGETEEARKAWEQAIADYERLESVALNREEWLHLASSAQSGYGWFLRRSGSKREATARLAQCVALRKQLHEGWPDKDMYASRYASAVGDHAQMLPPGQWDAAERKFDSAVARLEALVAEHPDKIGYKRDLARLLGNFARRLMSRGQRGEAEAHRERAIELQEDIMVRNPDDESDRARYANACRALGEVLRSEARPADAHRYQQKAVAAYRTLTDDFPATPRHRERYGSILGEAAALAAARGRPEDALQAREEQVLQYEMLVRMFPSRSRYRTRLAEALGELAEQQTDLGLKSDAERRLRQRLSLLLDDATDTPSLSHRISLSIAARELAELIRSSRSSKKKSEASQLLADSTKWVQGITVDEVLSADLSADRRVAVLSALVSLAKSTSDNALRERCYVALGELFEQRLAAAPESLTRKSNLAKNCFYYGRFLENRERYQEQVQQLLRAVELGRELIRADPSSSRYMKQMIDHSLPLGASLMRLERPEQAANVLQEILDLAKQSAEDRRNEGSREMTVVFAYEMLGNAWVRAGDYGKGEAALQQAVSLSGVLKHEPGFERFEATVYSTLAWFYCTCPDPEFRDYPKSIELAKHTISLQPDRATSHSTLGLALYETAEFEAAIESLQKAAELSPETAAFDELIVSMCEFRLGQFEAARATYDAAVKASADYPREQELFDRYQQQAEALFESQPACAQM